MCGRFLIDGDAVSSIEELVPLLWEEIPLDFHFGTIYPSTPSIVIEEKDGSLAAAIMPFGFQSESMKRRIINARSETASSRPMFARAWRSRRCAVPASRFYEWTPEKRKITFSLPDKTMYLASLVIDDTFVILTKDADASVSPYHHRMPVVLEQDQVADWILHPEQSLPLIENAAPVLNATGDPIQPTLF